MSQSLAEWKAQGKARRLWQRDASLWTGKDEAGGSAGWASPTGNWRMSSASRIMADAVWSAGFAHVSCSAWEARASVPSDTEDLRRIPGFPELHVLDSTDPAQVKACEDRVDLARTLFIVSSKSGSTLKPNIFKQYFFHRVVEVVGEKEAGSRFIAITDPHSKMQHVAEAEGFRRIFFGWPDIGGRYSVLSDFGLVPAAAMGVDVARFLDRTEAMVCAFMPSVPVEENPGVVLGSILGVAAKRFGRDKLTIVSSPEIASLGSWLEQLIAESTGKDGKGVIHRSREARAARQLWPRPPVRVSHAGVQSPMWQKTSWPPRWRAPAIPSCASRSRMRTTWAGILPLGDGNRGRGFHPRH